MHVKFEFNGEAVKQLIHERAKALLTEYETEINQLAHSMRGKPVDEVAQWIRTIVKKYGGDSDDKMILNWAELLSNGRRINFRLER